MKTNKEFIFWNFLGIKKCDKEIERTFTFYDEQKNKVFVQAKNMREAIEKIQNDTTNII